MCRAFNAGSTALKEGRFQDAILRDNAPAPNVMDALLRFAECRVAWKARRAIGEAQQSPSGADKQNARLTQPGVSDFESVTNGKS